MRLYRERGGTYAETARELGVDPGSPSDWVGRADAAQAPAGGQPLPDGGGPPRAEARERTAEEGERDAFKSERPLRRQAAVGSRAEGAKFAFVKANEGAWTVSEMCSALKVARQGYYAWVRKVAEYRAAVEGIFASEAFAAVARFDTK